MVCDSLERIEHLMALEESVIDQINSDRSLTLWERGRLIREVELRTQSGHWDDNDFDERQRTGRLRSLSGASRPGEPIRELALTPEC